VASNLHYKFSNFGNQRSTALSSSDFGKSDGFQYSSRGVYMFKFFFFRKLVNSWILYREQVLKHFLSTWFQLILTMNRENQIMADELNIQAGTRPPTPFPTDSMDELQRVCINFIDKCCKKFIEGVRIEL
jgi:hypothetical protein